MEIADIKKRANELREILGYGLIGVMEEREHRLFPKNKITDVTITMQLLEKIAISEGSTGTKFGEDDVGGLTARFLDDFAMEVRNSDKKKYLEK